MVLARLGKAAPQPDRRGTHRTSAWSEGTNVRESPRGPGGGVGTQKAAPLRKPGLKSDITPRGASAEGHRWLPGEGKRKRLPEGPRGQPPCPGPAAPTGYICVTRHLACGHLPLQWVPLTDKTGRWAGVTVRVALGGRRPGGEGPSQVVVACPFGRGCQPC